MSEWIAYSISHIACNTPNNVLVLPSNFDRRDRSARGQFENESLAEGVEILDDGDMRTVDHQRLSWIAKHLDQPLQFRHIVD